MSFSTVAGMAEAGGRSVTAGWEESVGGVLAEVWRGRGEFDNLMWKKNEQSAGWKEALPAPPPQKKQPSVPIKRTDVHLCNKLQTRVALGAIESPHCVRISHSWDH